MKQIVLYNSGKVPLVIDVSVDKSLYRSANGQNARGIIDVGGILKYCDREGELEDVLDKENPAFVMFRHLANIKHLLFPIRRLTITCLKKLIMKVASYID